MVRYNNGSASYSDLQHETTCQPFIAKCDHPRDLLSAESNVSVSEIEGYNGFPVEGSTVRFSCPSGLDLIGCHSSKCTEIGEWEPDFSQLTCNSGDHTLSTIFFSL